MSSFREYIGSTIMNNGRQTANRIIDQLDGYLAKRDAEKAAPAMSLNQNAVLPQPVRDHYNRITASANHQLIQDRELLKERLREVERQSAFLSAAVTQENQKAREFSKQYVETAQTLARFRGEWVPPCYSDPLTGYWRLGFDRRPGGLTYISGDPGNEDSTAVWVAKRPTMLEGDLYPCHPALYHGVQQAYGDPVTVGHWLDRR